MRIPDKYLYKVMGYLFSEREFRYRIINKLEEIAGQHTSWLYRRE
jgi:hypothetical protein